MKKAVLLVIFLALCIGNIGSADARGFIYGNDGFYAPVEPRLRYPINDTVTLNGNEPLEFKWWNDVIGTSKFIFKIYKGYNMYAAGLILKEELPENTSSFSVKSELFADGQVYTWSLVRVSNAGYKSDKSFNSFKVIRK